MAPPSLGRQVAFGHLVLARDPTPSSVIWQKERKMNVQRPRDTSAISNAPTSCTSRLWPRAAGVLDKATPYPDLDAESPTFADDLKDPSHSLTFVSYTAGSTVGRPA